jgi:Sulfatase
MDTGRLAKRLLTLAVVLGSLPAAAQKKPNILVIFGDDIGLSDVSAYSFGMMGIQTPNIDRIAKEGLMFTDYYARQRPSSFSVDQIMEKFTTATTPGGQ